MSEFKDPPEIWLEPACAVEDRGWSETEIQDCEEEGCGLRAPRYILADNAEAEIARLRHRIEHMEAGIRLAHAASRDLEVDRRLMIALAQSSPNKPSRVGKGIAAELPDHVLAICIAYESGFGHASRDLCNPYSQGSDAWHAYAHGKTEGESRSEDQS